MSEDLDELLGRVQSDPALLARYDVTQDGELDDHELALLRRILQHELRTAQERATTWSLTLEPTVLRDRFELVGMLGRGGQAFTYLARDREHGGRHVVVKELAIRVAEDWKSIELFEREAAVLERLTHPRIPRYVDAFHLEDAELGTRFMLVQDFVDGADLGHVTKDRRRWTEVEAIRRLVEVCDILDYLHSKVPAVIHRDIKPSNLIVGRDDALYLVDFGAVQTVVPTTVGGSTIIGTSGYVPMEQYMGHAEPASDLYALGATAVHLLSGMHPADLPFKRGRLQFDEHIDVSEEFRTLLAAMLDPDVERRPGGAAELRSALCALLPSEPAAPNADERFTFQIITVPAGASVGYRSRKMPGRTPLEISLTRAELPATLLIQADDHFPREHTVREDSPQIVEIGLEPKPRPLAVPSTPTTTSSPLPTTIVVPRRPAAPVVSVERGRLQVAQTAVRRKLGWAAIALLVGAAVISAILQTFTGVAFAIALAAMALKVTLSQPARATLNLDRGHWRIDGSAGWRNLRTHGSGRLFGDEVTGETAAIRDVRVEDGELRLELASGDIAFMRLPQLAAGEAAWLRDEVAQAVDHLRGRR